MGKIEGSPLGIRECGLEKEAAFSSSCILTTSASSIVCKECTRREKFDDARI